MNRDVCEHFNPVDLPCDKCKSASVQKSTLREAAQAVLNRWDSPAWEWLKQGPTAALMADLRAALAEPTVPSDCADSHQPVAWMLTDADNHKIRFLEWQQETRAYSGEWIKTPLYAAPPQRKPLTEEEIKHIDDSTHFHESPDWILRFARAIERAHGIGEKE